MKKDTSILCDPVSYSQCWRIWLCSMPEIRKGHSKEKLVERLQFHVVWQDSNNCPSLYRCRRALPPSMITYPEVHFANNILDGFPEAVFGRPDNGWMDLELFFTWLRDTFIASLAARHVTKSVYVVRRWIFNPLEFGSQWTLQCPVIWSSSHHLKKIGDRLSLTILPKSASSTPILPKSPQLSPILSQSSCCPDHRCYCFYRTEYHQWC